MALALLAVAGFAAAGEWRATRSASPGIREPAMAGRPEPLVRRPSPICNLVLPESRLGLWRWEDGRRVPARRTGDRRAEMFRRGDAQPLREGVLAATPLSGAAAGSVPGQDTLRLLVVRVEFETDRSGSATSGDGRFNLSPPDTINVPVDPTPHGRDFTLAHCEALRRYYEVTTNGRLVLEYDVYPKTDTAYRTTDMADFGPWEFSQDIFPLAYDLMRAFAVAADTQGVDIPWGDFDRVVFHHAGSDLQSDVRQDSPGDIPTFTIGVPDSLAIPLADSSVYLQATMMLPETTNQDGYFAALNAVFAHECGHLIFGWRDVYDVFTGLPTCGYWTLMDTGNLAGTIVQTGDGAGAQQFFAIGVLPPLTDPYQMHLIWDDVPAHDPPTWGAVDSLSPPQLSARALRVPISSEEYVLLENRRADLNGDNQIILVRDPATRVILGPGSADSLEYDFLLPGDGILAWHVDESIVGFDPPGRRIDAFFTINGNRDRFGLQIFEADALDDLGDFTSPFALGSPYDPFFVPNNGKLEPGGRPPLVTNSRTNPHLSIEVLDTLRLSMRVRVSRQWAVDGWPVAVRPGPHGVDPLVVDFGGTRRVVYSAADSAIHARAPDGSPAGGSGDVLWQGAESVSRVAEYTASGGGKYVLAVTPDPERLAEASGALDGSRVIAVDAGGSPAPGFPRAVATADADPACPWITAPPVVVRAGGESWILLGTRCGSVRAVRADGLELEIARSASPIRALAAHVVAGTVHVAFADSLGGVGTSAFSGGAAPEPPLPGAAALGPPGWSPRLAWMELNTGAGGSAQTPSPDPLPELVVVSRTTGQVWVFLAGGSPASATATALSGIGAGLADGLAAGDLDGDGFLEVVLATQDGRIGFWNLSGGATPGWPAPFEADPFPTQAAPLVADLDAQPGLELVHATGGGRIFALDRERRPLPGWPIGTGAGQASSPALADVDGDGSLELLLADADSLLHAIHTGAASSGAVWAVWGGDPGRSFALTQAPTSGGVGGSDLLSDGSLVVYPNPAKRQPVVLSFSLAAPARVRLTVFDTSGREIARLEQDGLLSDNHLRWDPAEAAPGVYLGRLELEGGGRKETHVVRMGVIR